MKPSLKFLAFTLLLSAQSCSSFDFGDALFTGLCVWSEADCLKSCGAAYDADGSKFAYNSCAHTCQPSGYSDCD